MDAITFASHTSVITKNLLEEEIKGERIKRGLEQAQDIQEADDPPVSSNFASKQAGGGGKKSVKVGDEHALVKDINEERKFELEYNEYAEESRISATRVKINAVSFDWVFDGNNCENLILYLVNHGDSTLFKTKSIKIYIMLLWKEF